MKEKLLLDIDGVIADFYRGFARYLNEKLNAGIDLDIEPTSYNMSDWDHNIPRDIVYAEVPLWMTDRGYLDIPIYPGAAEFVYKLMDKYDVYIVTARIGDFKINLPRALQKIIKEDTIEWFKSHGIPADKLFFEHKKIDFCKNNSIKILIEDKLPTILRGANDGIQSILIDRGWNQEGGVWEGKALSRKHKNVHVAYNYDDVLNILEKLL